MKFLIPFNIFNSEKVKVKVPKVLYETIKESDILHDMSVSDYMSYLVYKEDYFHLSSNSLQKEKALEKYYEKYNEEKAEKDVWATLFNF